MSLRTHGNRSGYGDSWVHNVASQKDDEIKILRSKLLEAQAEIERLQESVKNYRSKFIQASVKNAPTRQPLRLSDETKV